MDRGATGYGYGSMGMANDIHLDQIKKHLMMYNDMLTIDGPPNIFKMPVYQLAQEQQQV